LQFYYPRGFYRDLLIYFNVSFAVLPIVTLWLVIVLINERDDDEIVNSQASVVGEDCLYVYWQNGYTPLHIAAKMNRLNIAKILLRYGANAEAQSKVGVASVRLSVCLSVLLVNAFDTFITTDISLAIKPLLLGNPDFVDRRE